MPDIKNLKLWVKWPQIWDPKASLSPTWYTRYPENPYEKQNFEHWVDLTEINWADLSCLHFPKSSPSALMGESIGRAPGAGRHDLPRAVAMVLAGDCRILFQCNECTQNLFIIPEALSTHPPTFYLQLLFPAIIISQSIISFVLLSYAPLPLLFLCIPFPLL